MGHDVCFIFATPYFFAKVVIATIKKSIKQIMKENHVKQFEVAYILGMHEGSLSRKLRNGETEELRNKIVEAIKQINSGQDRLRKGMFSTMANKRMIDVRIVSSNRFLCMGKAAQALYMHILANSDDEGVTEAGTVLRITRSRRTALQELIDNNFVTLLERHEDIVYTNNWHSFNKVDARYGRPSYYHKTLEEHFPDIEFVDFKQKNGSLPVGDSRTVEVKRKKEKSSEDSTVINDDIHTERMLTKSGDFFDEYTVPDMEDVLEDIALNHGNTTETKMICIVAVKLFRLKTWKPQTCGKLAERFMELNRSGLQKQWTGNKWQAMLDGFVKAELTDPNYDEWANDEEEEYDDLPFQ